jgi:hypothetical protein
VGSPAEVQWTGDLCYFASFLPLEPSEVQRKSNGSPTIFCFKVTSPDFHRTRTGQAAEFGQVRRIPLEVRRTVRWVRRNWLGPVKVRWNPSEKGGECKVHMVFEKYHVSIYVWAFVNGDDTVVYCRLYSGVI